MNKQTNKIAKKPRRSTRQVVIDILDCLLFNRLSLKMTVLMQKANIEGRRLTNIYIPYLMSKEFVQVGTDNKVTITNKGIKYFIICKKYPICEVLKIDLNEYGVDDKNES